MKTSKEKMSDVDISKAQSKIELYLKHREEQLVHQNIGFLTDLILSFYKHEAENYHQQKLEEVIPTKKDKRNKLKELGEEIDLEVRYQNGFYDALHWIESLLTQEK